MTILWTISLKILWKISRSIPESRIDTMKVGLALSGTISDISRGQFQGQLEEQFQKQFHGQFQDILPVIIGYILCISISPESRMDTMKVGMGLLGTIL